MYDFENVKSYLWAIRAGSNHVGLEKSSFKKDMLLIECLVNSCKHSFSNSSTFGDVMSPISQNLRLNNGHKAILLANDGIACQALCILLDGKLRGLSWANFEDCTPLGEACTSLVVLLAPSSERVESLSGGFTICASQLNNTLVHFDAWDDIVLLKDLNKRLPIGGFLVKSFLKEDDTREVLEGIWSGEEKLAKGLAVGLNVLNVNAR